MNRGWPKNTRHGWKLFHAFEFNYASKKVMEEKYFHAFKSNYTGKEKELVKRILILGPQLPKKRWMESISCLEIQLCWQKIHG
jgi:hypothetical protein